MLLFRPDYTAGPEQAWQTVQQPAAVRITLVTAPGRKSTARPLGKALRVELRPGDVTVTSGYTANRAEVYDRAPVPMSTPAEQWPDPVGSERWYGFSLHCPASLPRATDTKWVVLTQWKGLRGGSPPIALEIKRSNLRLGGARTNAGLIPNGGDLGLLPSGGWTRLVIGLLLSPTDGWVHVFRDGVEALPRTTVATMDSDAKGTDPIYLKQGIYRDARWTDTHVLHFGPVRVGEGPDDVS